MESATLAVPDQELVPITASQRIEALDVVRGFALLGIFLMNIEYFNRTLSSLDEGMPRGLTGIDWLASWFIAYFVQGKFWTIFSLLFGMGFAVMMTRAARASVASEPRERSGAEGVPASESVGGTGGAKPPGEEMTRAAQAGRAFKIVYLRRVLALAVFGAAHFVLLWEGDILFSYAVAALMLMIVLYGTLSSESFRPRFTDQGFGVSTIPPSADTIHHHSRRMGGRDRHETHRVATPL